MNPALEEPMPDFRIGDRVTHLPTNVSGRVIGLNTDRVGSTLVDVEYTLTTGEVADRWFPLGELRLDDRPQEA